MNGNGDTALDGETSERPSASTVRSVAMGFSLAAGLMSAALLTVHGHAVAGGALVVMTMTGFVAAGAKSASTTAQDGEEQ